VFDRGKIAAVSDSYGWRGQRNIRRLRQNAAVTVVSEAGRALQVNASARAFTFR
jgi:hypothetical protein